jgi:hypothetical protein
MTLAPLEICRDFPPIVSPTGIRIKDLSFSAVDTDIDGYGTDVN